MRLRAGRISLAAAGLVAVLGLAMALIHTPGRAAPTPEPAAAPAVPVQVVKAKVADVPVMLSNIGAVQAYNSVLVRARVSGTLEQVLFHEGQEVTKGQLLAIIDPRPYAAALGQALAKQAADKAMLVSAEKDLVRDKNLARDKFGTMQSVDQQTAQVGQLAADIEGDAANIVAARLNLEFTQITAPISGRAGLRQVDAGNLIQANGTQPIVMIDQIHPISVLFSLPQDDLPRVQAAMRTGKLPVRAFTSDYKTELGQGALLTIDDAVDPTTGTFKLKATFPNTHDRLWPGQFINVRMQIGVIQNAVTVPSPAVQRGPDGLYAYVVGPDARASRRTITVRQNDGTTAVVASGLKPGETVVVNGQSRLTDGTLVAAGA